MFATLIVLVTIIISRFFSSAKFARELMCREISILMPGDVDGIVPRLACILTKQHGIRGRKHVLKTLGNAITETLIFKMSLDGLALKNLCEFQSRLLFIISLLLKNFLTALSNQVYFFYIFLIDWRHCYGYSHTEWF